MFKKMSFERVLQVVFVICFGITFFCLSFCSLRAELAKITWIFTFLLILIAMLFFFYKKCFSFDLVNLSIILFLILSFCVTLIYNFDNFKFTVPLCLIVFFITYSFTKNNKILKKYLILAAFLSTLIFSLCFIFKYKEQIISFDFDVRLGSDFGDENDVTLFFGFGLMMSLYYMFFSKKWFLKILSVFPALLFVVSGVATGSKIFLVSCFLTFLLLLFLYFGKKKVYISIIISLIFIAGFLYILLSPRDFALKDRFLQLIDTFFGTTLAKHQQVDLSSLTRLDLFKSGICLFLKRPLFGYGYAGFRYNSYTGGWSHNTISEILCNYGVIGFILFFIPFVNLFADFFRKMEKNKYVSVIIGFYFLCCCLSVSLDVEKIYMYLMGVIICDSSTFDLVEIGYFNKKITIKNLFKNCKDKLSTISI